MNIKAITTAGNPPLPMPTIEAVDRAVPPPWARLQRSLLQAMEQAALAFVDHYTRADGTLPWRAHWPGMDGADDPYEGFQGLPMLYILGGSERMLDLAHRQWEAVTRQWTEYGQVHREFFAYYDWMHHGEGNNLFFSLGMADPHNVRLQQRAIRFADFYTGEDPTAPNYDPARRLTLSPFTGSRGPRFIVTAEDWSTHRPVLDHYPPPFEDLPDSDGSTCRWTDDKVFDEILKRMNARMTRGDVPLNLTATSLLTHAFLRTNEQRFKQWVLDYHDAWLKRTERNNGIIPDNVGLDDEIGQYLDGKWWGGYYGWRWPHGATTVLEATAIGSINAVLLDGKTSHLDLIRTQLDMLWSLGRKRNNTWVVPHKHLDAGWSDYRPLDPRIPVACWSTSQNQEDLHRVVRLTDSHTWGKPTQNVAKANGAANSHHWFAFIQGRNPDYPTQILETNYRQMLERLDQIRNDKGDPAEWDIHHWQLRSPIFTEGLVQLMLGSPLHLYHGGLQFATLRYFDPESRRPGLPSDVAALVSHIDATSATLTLVNCATTSTRDVVVQAGGYGEHTIVAATRLTRSELENQTVEVNGTSLHIHLGASTLIQIKLTMRRFANEPSYAQGIN